MPPSAYQTQPEEVNRINVIRDRIMNADPKRVGTTLMSIIDTLQDANINDQVQASACLFVMFCTRFGLSPNDLITASSRLLADTEMAELKAARAYINHEWD